MLGEPRRRAIAASGRRSRRCPARSLFAGDFYDYGAKYPPGGMELIVPARHLRERAAERVRDSRSQAFGGAGCGGLARVDFFVEASACCSTS